MQGGAGLIGEYQFLLIKLIEIIDKLKENIYTSAVHFYRRCLNEHIRAN